MEPNEKVSKIQLYYNDPAKRRELEGLAAQYLKSLSRTEEKHTNAFKDSKIYSETVGLYNDVMKSANKLVDAVDEKTSKLGIGKPASTAKQTLGLQARGIARAADTFAGGAISKAGGIPKAENTAEKAMDIGGTVAGLTLGALPRRVFAGAQGAAYGAAEKLKDEQGNFNSPMEIGKSALVYGAAGLGLGIAGAGAVKGAAALAKEVTEKGAKVLSRPLWYMFNPKVRKLLRSNEYSAEFAGKITEELDTAHVKLQQVFEEGLNAVATKNPAAKLNVGNMVGNIESATLQQMDEAGQTVAGGNLRAVAEKVPSLRKFLSMNPEKLAKQEIDIKQTQEILRDINKLRKSNPYEARVLKDYVLDSASSFSEDLVALRGMYAEKITVIKELNGVFGKEMRAVKNLPEIERNGWLKQQTQKVFSPEMIKQMGDYNDAYAFRKFMDAMGQTITKGMVQAGAVGGGIWLLNKSQGK
jgi:hypothetical protein